MNIFLMILVVLFMGGYFMFNSPSTRITSSETAVAVERADLRSIAECAAAVQNAAINGMEFDDICVDQAAIENEFICLNASLAVTKCDAGKNKKSAYSYIVTATAPINPDEYDQMMDLLEKYYGDAGTFGIYYDGKIMSGATTTRRIVPKGVISQMGLANGQLVYITQYEVPDTGASFTTPDAVDVYCPAGTVKTYRFGRWQCVGYNMKTTCGGDMVWDYDMGECVPDQSRKPLCADKQTAVIVDDVWECLDPFEERQCPGKMIARLNYNTLEWECIEDPTQITDTKRCSGALFGPAYGMVGSTLRVPASSCTDCERLVTDTDTCTAACVPDASRLTDARCYGGAARECSGSNRGFYFGFPNRDYVANVSGLAGVNVPFDADHSQNRKFNCMECPNGINTDRSMPPYVIVCN